MGSGRISTAPSSPKTESGGRRISLDGVVEAPDQWHFPYFNEEMGAAGWRGFTRRVDATLLGEVAWPAEHDPLAFVCGPTSFVETVASGLVELGYRPERVKTERFGATGER